MRASSRARLERYSQREFMFVKRRVSPEMRSGSRSCTFEGVHFEREYRRYYPGRRNGGARRRHHKRRRPGSGGCGTRVRCRVEERAGPQTGAEERQRESIKDVEYVTAPQFGHDLALSVDLRLQYFAYRELKSAIEEHHAKVRIDGDARCAHR